MFWLGITIYCLPSFNSQTTAPNPSPIGSQCRPTKAADTGRLCEWEVVWVGSVLGAAGLTRWSAPKWRRLPPVGNAGIDDVKPATMTRAEARRKIGQRVGELTIEGGNISASARGLQSAERSALAGQRRGRDD